MPATQFENRDGDAITVLDRWFGSWRISIERRPFGAQEMCDAYDRKAAHWKETLRRFGGERAYKKIAAQFAAQANIPGSHKRFSVLDCGAGDGAFATALAEVAPCRIDAVDVSPEMLRQAEKRYSQSGAEATCHIADARHLPFSDNVFDVALAAHIVEHMPEPGRALSELFRVLKPGGVLITSLTRASLTGRLIQLKWRTHCLSRRQGEQLHSEAGFEAVQSWRRVGVPVFDLCSIAYHARKPDSVATCGGPMRSTA